MNLKDILITKPFENLIVEYKEKLDRNNLISWLKTICGFANARGGCLIIGVKDQTLDLVGFNKAEAESERNLLNNLINETCTPRPRTTIDFIEYTIRNKNRFIIQLTVNESNVKPVILTYKGVPAIYMRRDGFTNGATLEEIIQMSISSITNRSKKHWVNQCLMQFQNTNQY